MSIRWNRFRQLSVQSMLVLTFLAGVLAAGFRNGYRDVSEFDRLIYLIQSTIVPDTWEAVGGSGSIAPYPPVSSSCPIVVVSPESDPFAEGETRQQESPP